MRNVLAIAVTGLALNACATRLPQGQGVDAPGPTVDAAADSAVDAPSGDPRIAWYHDGITTNTASTNDFTALGVTADTITVAQLTTLIETSKYSSQPRAQDQIVDFDEVFLSRAQNAGFMTKLGKASGKVLGAGWSKLIVYCNGWRSMAEAVPNGWSGIATAGAMIGLEAYTTTFWTYVSADLTQYPFQDSADLPTAIATNPDLYAAFKAKLTEYVHNSKTQLGDPTLYEHLTLVEFENMAHDLTALQNFGYSAAKAKDAAALWYAALEEVAKTEGIHYGIYHPA
jgi:hypothetical protein